MFDTIAKALVSMGKQDVMGHQGEPAVHTINIADVRLWLEMGETIEEMAENYFMSAADFRKELAKRGFKAPPPKGVSETPHGTYRAFYTRDGKSVTIGFFKTVDEAVAARNALIGG